MEMIKADNLSYEYIKITETERPIAVPTSPGRTAFNTKNIKTKDNKIAIIFFISILLSLRILFFVRNLLSEPFKNKYIVSFYSFSKTIAYPPLHYFTLFYYKLEVIHILLFEKSLLLAEKSGHIEHLFLLCIF